MRLNYLKHFIHESGRPHVPDAISVILERYQSGECYTSIAVPPRCGKTAIIEASAYELRFLGAPFCLAAAPWDLVADQLIDAETIGQNIKRYAGGSLPKRYVSNRVQHLRDHNFYRSIEPTDLHSCTMGLLMANRTTFLDSVDTAFEGRRQRAVLFVDEAHLLARRMPWAAIIEEAVEHHCYVVVLTGTSKRRDNKQIPGFTFESNTDWKTIEARLIHKKVDEDGVVRFYQQTHEVRTKKGEDKANVNLPWNEAFEKGWLSKINFIFVDDRIHLKDMDGATEVVAIKDIPAKRIRGMLRELSERESIINKTVDVLIGRLTAWRKGGLMAKCLIVTGSDDLGADSSDRNRHARMIRRAVQSACDTRSLLLRIEVATSVTGAGEPDDKANTKIKAFRGDKESISEVGAIDVLIVKMMGLVGLDMPDLKVMGNLSTVREGPMAAQMLTRVATQWDAANGKNPDVVLLNDALNVSLVEELASMGAVAKKTESTLLNEEEIDPPEIAIESWESDNMPYISGYADQSGHNIIGDNEVLLYAIKRKFLTGNLTDAELLINHANGAYGDMQEEVAAYHEQADEARADEGMVIDQSARANNLRGKFGKEARKFAANLVSPRTDPEKFRTTVMDLQARAKRRIGVNIAVDTIDDPDMLDRCINALPGAYREMVDARK